MSSKSSAASKIALYLPKAKTKDIVIQELENEMLVYDLENDKAHHLNDTVAMVWKCCDGRSTVGEITKRLKKRSDLNVDEDFVWLALDELAKGNLLEEVVVNEDFSELSRRTVLFKYAPMAVALPIVMSLVAPPAAHAQSCLAPGILCTDPIQCCSGACAETCQMVM